MLILRRNLMRHLREAREMQPRSTMMRKEDLNGSNRAAVRRKMMRMMMKKRNSLRKK
jgi:hypothetical protein